MSLISSGIRNVRVYRLAAGIAADGSSVSCPSEILVEWHSTNTDKLHQIYINGRLEGTTANSDDRKILLPYRQSYKGVITLKVYAVEFKDAFSDHSDELENETLYERIELSWPRKMSLPYEGSVDIYSNGGEGEIDFTVTANTGPVWNWPCLKDKSGFGLCGFGQSDFGYDGSSAPGFGVMNFGTGEFGFDADMVRWQSRQLSSGRYKYGIVVKDRFGVCDVGESVSDEITVVEGPDPADALKVESFNKQNNTLVLRVN